MFEIIQVTAQYSNAVLVAIMPYVSDCAKKLDLPVPQPVTVSQVQQFVCSPRGDLLGGRVILTNSYEFVFLHGRVEMFRNSKSFYELQDPKLVPQFFGPVKLNEKQAITAARETLKKLGYTESALFADRKPNVQPPARIGKNYVPRYRIQWNDPTRGDPANPPLSVALELNATTGQPETMYLNNPETWRPDPTVSVRPTVIKEGPKTEYRGGRQIVPVTSAYSNAFLNAILPQCSKYARIAHFPVPNPLTTNDVNMSTYVCGLVEGDPCAFLDLKSGARFVYSHGQVVAYYSPDVMQLPGRDPPPFPEYENFQKRFYGPLNMTTNEAVQLVRQTIKRLGYSEKILHLDEHPRIGGPNRWGTNYIARCFLNWQQPNQGAFRAVAEVDLASKAIKSLYINDHVNTNIWRVPPSAGVPAQVGAR